LCIGVAVLREECIRRMGIGGISLQDSFRPGCVERRQHRLCFVGISAHMAHDPFERNGKGRCSEENNRQASAETTRREPAYEKVTRRAIQFAQYSLKFRDHD
jgi:hypothetical protein